MAFVGRGYNYDTVTLLSGIRCGLGKYKEWTGRVCGCRGQRMGCLVEGCGRRVKLHPRSNTLFFTRLVDEVEYEGGSKKRLIEYGTKTRACDRGANVKHAIDR
jgi:hypothetical protein